ncbi:MAG: hypothetical protein CM1200mP16_04770 [Nitrospina sp.]|nr:MAG: hypothetical protein CM1200mP16_04770 [Nitrospina sp.]
MAKLGIRKFDNLIGKVELLEGSKAVGHWKASGIDVSKILFKPEVDANVALRNVCTQDLRGILIMSLTID